MLTKDKTRLNDQEYELAKGFQIVANSSSKYHLSQLACLFMKFCGYKMTNTLELKQILDIINGYKNDIK